MSEVNLNWGICKGQVIDWNKCYGWGTKLILQNHDIRKKSIFHAIISQQFLDTEQEKYKTMPINYPR